MTAPWTDADTDRVIAVYEADIEQLNNTIDCLKIIIVDIKETIKDVLFVIGAGAIGYFTIIAIGATQVHR